MPSAASFRLDDLSTLGVSTQTLAEEAIARGDWEQARSLVDYFYEEMRIMHGILTTWIRDILRYVVEHSGADDAAARAASAGMARMLEAIPSARPDASAAARPSRPGTLLPRSTGWTGCGWSSRTRTRCWWRGSRTC